MRKILGVCLLALCLTGCRNMMENEATGLTVCASFYPVYALTAPVTADVPDLTLQCLVQPQDGCLRAYELSDWDAAILNTADAVVIGGRGLESFESYLMGLGETGPAVIAAMEAMELNNQDDIVPDGDEDEASHLRGANPWLFLSVGGARQIAESVAANMIALDPRYEARYAENLHALDARLEALLTEMEETLLAAPYCPVALLHEGLVYFADEFGLDVALTLDRESGSDYAEDAEAQAIAALKEAGARVLLLEKQAPTRLKRALREAGFALAEFDTLSTRAADGDGEGYFAAMRENARALAAAFRQVAGA